MAILITLVITAVVTKHGGSRFFGVIAGLIVASILNANVCRW